MSKACDQHGFYPIIKILEANNGRFHALLDANFWSRVVYIQKTTNESETLRELYETHNDRPLFPHRLHVAFQVEYCPETCCGLVYAWIGAVVCRHHGNVDTTPFLVVSLVCGQSLQAFCGCAGCMGRWIEVGVVGVGVASL